MTLERDSTVGILQHKCGVIYYPYYRVGAANACVNPEQCEERGQVEEKHG